MRHTRFYHWSQEQGIQLHDKLEFYPVEGHKKVINLGRTCYYFEKGERSFCQLWGHDYPQVKLVWHQHFQSDKSGNYYLESLSDQPFLYNGQYAWKVFLSHGDEVYLGYNRLQFLHGLQRPEHQSESTQDFNIHSQKVYRSKLNILIEGETGVGKTYLAKKIHEQSQRTGPFVHLNLSSFSPSLLESELFGHVKGAFTGASSDKRGGILEAHRGTLFLDEIDSLPRDIQVKLLLFLDDQKVRAVGGSRSQQTDVRLIFASGQSLEKCVERAELRKDFFYRVSSGHRIYLKSLREKTELIESFIHEYLQSSKHYIGPKLLRFYKTLKWPGNYRQLKSHLDKKIVCSQTPKLSFDEVDRELNMSGLPLGIRSAFHGPNLNWKELKKSYINQSYHELGSFQAAAIKIGVNEKTVRRVVKELSQGIDKGASVEKQALNTLH